MTSSLTLDAAPLAPVTRLAVSSERATDAARTAVDKAFEILAALPAGGQFVGVSELARSMRLSKSTVFRLLTTMERNGFVEREGGRYRLGRRLHDIGAQVYEPRPGSLHELLSPIMAALYERSRETVHLGVLRDNEVVLLGRLHGRRTTPHALRLGSRFPAHCSAMGKAMLAHDPDATDALLTRGLIARTPRSIVCASSIPRRTPAHPRHRHRHDRPGSPPQPQLRRRRTPRRRPTTRRRAVHQRTVPGLRRPPQHRTPSRCVRRSRAAAAASPKR